MHIMAGMTRSQFLRRLRGFCRRHDLTFLLDEARGKGSHVTVEVERRRTIVKGGELSPVYIKLVLRQLGLPDDAV